MSIITIHKSCTGETWPQNEPGRASEVDTRKHLYSIFYYFILQFCLTVNKLIHITTPQDHGTGIPVLFFIIIIIFTNHFCDSRKH